MRLVAYRHLREYWQRHPDAKAALLHWHEMVKLGQWRTMQDVLKDLPTAKILDGRRARFEVAGGDFRLIAGFFFPASLVYVKFIGTHAEYDRVDALTVAMF